jgi:hypothetical protein
LNFSQSSIPKFPLFDLFYSKCSFEQKHIKYHP